MSLTIFFLTNPHSTLEAFLAIFRRELGRQFQFVSAILTKKTMKPLILCNFTSVLFILGSMILGISDLDARVSDLVYFVINFMDF